MNIPDERIIKSYVFHKDRCFFVSTIERDSSAAADPGRYNETLVWDFDWDKNERRDLLYQESDIRGSISRHLSVCVALHRDGVLEDEP